MTYPLRNLKTRDPNDFAIALLDAWATVADVLTFYQERIANEGYLRTATERRSVLELARLIGYELRPGVASTVYLAYTLNEDKSVTPPKPTATTILKGNRVQSVPNPGELPQSFETSDELEARSQWNDLQARLSQPQTEESILLKGKDQTPQGSRVYLKGIATNLRQNDPLLIDFGSGKPELFRVIDVTPDAKADRTLVKLQPWLTAGASLPMNAIIGELVERHIELAKALPPVARNMAKASISNLKGLPDGIANLPDLGKVEFVKKQVVEKFAKTLAAAQPVPQKKKFAEWLGGVVNDLSKAIEAVSASGISAAAVAPVSSGSVIKSNELIEPLLKPASRPPANAARLGRDVKTTFTRKGDTGLQLLGTFQPSLRDTFPTALANAEVTLKSGIKVYALRVGAALFGHNAQGLPIYTKDEDGTLKITGYTTIALNEAWHGLITNLNPLRALALDAQYDQIKPKTWVIVEFPIMGTVDETPTVVERRLSFHQIETVRTASMSVSSLSSRVTQLEIVRPWMSELTAGARRTQFSRPEVLRGTTVFAQSEELPLADEPIAVDVCHGKDIPIELDEVYTGLESGRWLIVSGERTDIRNDAGVVVPGVKASELVMLAGVEQRFNGDLPGDKTHSFIRLAEDLAYCYKRDTVEIYANVVKATHGETRNETLGGGDPSKALQQFTLKQPPLTFVSAPNPSGVDSTLVVRANDIQWHETGSLAGSLPTDRKFVTRTDDDGKTTVIFGSGKNGARLPTGQENVKATYRNGIGKPGNVKAGQINLLVTQPLHVKEVVNPLPATGGADKENRDQARENAPLAVMSLDRLVSTQDYSDFARTFAGIGKASAARLSDGRRQLVHVTIAGVDDIPIDEHSDLFANLKGALRDFGDPYLPIQVEVRKLKLLVIQARVRVLPDYIWEKVEPNVRAALLDKFSFGQRDFGQDALLSEAISAIQAVQGVSYVDVDKFDGVDEQQVVDALAEKNKSLADQITLQPRVPVELAQLDLKETDPSKRIKPAELAYFSPDIPDTIILSEITK
jgi:predicted phage baseplate assembly protein